MSSEQATSQIEVVEQQHINDVEKKGKTLKDIVHNIIVLKKMYQKFKEHRINILNKFKDKHKFRGQKKYAIEYMQKHPTEMIKQGDLLLYCDKRRNEDTKGEKPNYSDNSRQIEQLRKNITPNCWIEKVVNGYLYFMYVPEVKELVTNEIINNSKHKKDDFSPEIKKSALEKSNYECEITGLPISDGNLACDHWNPKEGGGESKKENCVVLNKILNEKKNKHPPIKWFCKSLLSNFLNICKKTGMDLKKVKLELIEFIQEF